MAFSSVTLASANQVRWFIIGAGGVAVLFALAYVFLVALPAVLRRRRRAAVGLSQTKASEPLTARLATIAPESPFLPRPPAAVPAPPKMRNAADVYRYPGNRRNGERTIPKPKISSLPPKPAVKPLPMASVLCASTVHLHAVADGVVSAHPDALPLADRFESGTPTPVSFPWVSSAADVGPGKHFKFGLVRIIDTAPAPVDVKRKMYMSDKKNEFYSWGVVTHRLELPLRGNRMQRAPLVNSSKHNVTTNVVFDKGSPFCAADKENVGYSVMKEVCALA